MLAHEVDGSIAALDASNVFALAKADARERDEVIQQLSVMSVNILSAPVVIGGMDSIAAIGQQIQNQRSSGILRASEEQVAAARKVLERDRVNGKPSQRILKADEEVGLAALARGLDVPLDQELPERYRAHLEPGDERAQAFDALMLHNIRLVWSIARTRMADGLEAEDIAQYGMEGLRRGVEKFNATKGFKFSTYATQWIRQAISRGIDNESRLIRLPVHIVERLNRVLRARDALLTERGVFTISAIASATGLAPEQVIECLRLATGIVSLDRTISEDGDSLGDFIVLQTDSDADPAQVVDRRMLKQIVQNALEELSQREAFIIRLRAGIDQEEPATLEETGRRLGITRERVRQIEVKARTKLLAALTERGLGPIGASSSGSAAE